MQLEVENAGPAFTLRFRPGLPSGTRVVAAESSDLSRPRVGATGDAYEVVVICPAGRTSRLTLRLTRPTRARATATGPR